jgi:hypothetical protein
MDMSGELKLRPLYTRGTTGCMPYRMIVETMVIRK